MEVLALIPARMGSSRFPGKPMAALNGKPMIQHVYENVAQSNSLKMTAVATCDQVIADHIRSIGGLAVMTSELHQRASDRCAEALDYIEKEHGQRFDVIVMVQGDEPMITSKMIDEALEPFKQGENVRVVNLMAAIQSEEEFRDQNCIKVVVDQNEYALYMTRLPIPSGQNVGANLRYKQVCVIPFLRSALTQYLEMEPTPLEIAESIDMLRLLENGQPVKMVLTENQTHAVDTIEDLDHVARLMKQIG